MSNPAFYANGEEVHCGDKVRYAHEHGHHLSQFSKGVAVVLWVNSGSITLRNHKGSPSFQYFVDFNYKTGRYETDCKRTSSQLERISTLCPDERKQFIKDYFC